jgi:hypothetical protein
MAAPTHYVTRRSQLPAGAHAMFTAGRGYYSGPGPGTIPPPKPPTPKPPRQKSQSVSQVANQQVNQQLAPVIAGQDAQAKQQNDAIQSFALALLGKLQPVAGQVGQDYNQAIGQTAQLSGAAANALRSANPNQQDQQMLQAVGAPQEQRAQVASQLANTFGGGAAVTLFNQGQVPGTQLATDKASAQAQARQLPGIAALKGQQDLASALAAQRTERQTTLAQRPGMVQQATQTIKGNIAARDAAAYDRYKFQTARADALDAAGQKQAAQLARDRANLDYKYASLNSQNARTSATIKGENARAAATITGENDRAAASIKAKQAAKDTAGLKPSDRRAASKAIDLFYYGKEPKRKWVASAGGGGKWVRTPGTGVSGINYGQAIKKLVDGYGMTRAEATKLANDYYAPGEFGRPDPKRANARRRVRTDNAAARKGKDATGLGIQIAPAP